jgi:hypothetical protein
MNGATSWVGNPSTSAESVAPRNLDAFALCAAFADKSAAAADARIADSLVYPPMPPRLTWPSAAALYRRRRDSSGIPF